jgi:hypothetical protein
MEFMVMIVAQTSAHSINCEGQKNVVAAGDGIGYYWIMKFLKWLVIALVAIIALLFAVSFILPSRVHVERSLSMAASQEKVFAQVSNLRNWPAWSPWNLRDPEMKVQYEGPTEGAGQKSIWQSESQGDGSQFWFPGNGDIILEVQQGRGGDAGDMGHGCRVGLADAAAFRRGDGRHDRA